MSQRTFKFSVLALLLLGLIAVSYLSTPATARPALGVTNFDSIWLSDAGPTAQPVLRVNQRGAGMIMELQDSGTRVWGVQDGGGVTGKVLAEATPNLLSNCWTATITDTAAYTSLVTALSTPQVAWCNITVLSGDALHCGAIAANGSVTITVRNAAATPAANAAGVSVYSCAKGTR